MPSPIVFISHSRVRDGKLDELRQFMESGTPELRAGKPQTLAFLAYLNDDNTELSILHVFADSAALDIHFEGVAERSARAAQLLETQRFELFGQPSEAAMAVFERNAGSGVGLTIQPEFVAGWLPGEADDA